MKTTAAHLLRVFVAGLIAALPLAATIFVFWWGATTLVRWLGPESKIGSALVQVGLGVTGSEIVGYLIGVGLIVALIFGLGLVVEAGFERGLATLVGAVVRRIPVVRTVYDLSQKMVGLIAPRDADDDSLRSMSAVWCHFGGPGGAAALALLSTPQPVQIDGRSYLGVLVPTAPVPVGGGLLYVPAEWVTPAEVGMEAVTSIYVSMGVTSPQHLGVAADKARPPAAIQKPS
jgi:uncharacterized membrane protein